MSCNKDSYPKAIEVYEAVLRLMRDKRNITAMTVSEIAREAGIGKGTTYDYFSSKEEIIAKSLIYGYRKLIDTAVERMKTCETLKEKLASLQVLADCSGNINSFMEMAEKLAKNWDKMQDYIVNAFEYEKIHVLYIERLVDDLTEAARREGLIGDNADKDYVQCVFMSAFQNIVGPVRRVMVREGLVSRETWMDYLYQMVATALVQQDE